MKFFVGTSGWMYDWNEESSLDWYVKNSRLNAIELNASFYRFPFPNQVKHWAVAGKSLSWAVKVEPSDNAPVQAEQELLRHIRKVP